MKEFRIAKCLVNGEINEYAIFKDGSRKKRIYIDEQYGKYFNVDNELNTECKTALRFSFRDRIEDTVNTVRNGNGDCILQTADIPILGTIDNVVYFIDREIGEELRKQFIEGWKDAKFTYAVKCGNKNSFSGFRLITTKHEQMSVFDQDPEVITFETKDMAEAYIKTLLDRSAYYAKCIIDNMTDDEEESGKVIDKVLDKIEKYTGSRISVITEFMYDMLSDDCKSAKNNFELTDWGYKIVQYLDKHK